MLNKHAWCQGNESWSQEWLAFAVWSEKSARISTRLGAATGLFRTRFWAGWIHLFELPPPLKITTPFWSLSRGSTPHLPKGSLFYWVDVCRCSSSRRGCGAHLSPSPTHVEEWFFFNFSTLELLSSTLGDIHCIWIEHDFFLEIFSSQISGIFRPVHVKFMQNQSERNHSHPTLRPGISLLLIRQYYSTTCLDFMCST